MGNRMPAYGNDPWRKRATPEDLAKFDAAMKGAMNLDRSLFTLDPEEQARQDSQLQALKERNTPRPSMPESEQRPFWMRGVSRSTYTPQFNVGDLVPPTVSPFGNTPVEKLLRSGLDSSSPAEVFPGPTLDQVKPTHETLGGQGSQDTPPQDLPAFNIPRFDMTPYQKSMSDAYARQREAYAEMQKQLADALAAKQGESPDVDFTALAGLLDTWYGGNMAQSMPRARTRQDIAKEGDSLRSQQQQAMLAGTGVDVSEAKSMLDLAQQQQANDLRRQQMMYEAALQGRALDIKAAEKGATQQASSGQFLAAGFGQRAAAATATMEDLEAEGYNPTTARAGVRRGVPDMLGGNFIRTEQDQVQMQAERDFVNAILRNESGAAIADTEFASAEKQYFPRPGDTTETLAKKRENRIRKIAALRAESGVAWDLVDREIKAMMASAGGQRPAGLDKNIADRIQALAGGQQPAGTRQGVGYQGDVVYQGGSKYVWNAAEQKYE